MRTGLFLMRTGLFLMLTWLFLLLPLLPRPFTSKTWLFLMLPCCTTLHHNWLFLMLPPPPSFPPKSWAPPCQAARTSDDLRSHNRNPKCSSAALAHACFLRGYRFLPRAQATPVVHNLPKTRVPKVNPNMKSMFSSAPTTRSGRPSLHLITPQTL